MAKKKKQYKLHNLEKIGGTEVFAAATRALPEMMDLGAASGKWAHVNSTDCALYYKDKGKIIAFLIWTSDESDMSLSINLGWVDAGHRGQGLYTKLWNALVKSSRKAGIRTIWGTVLAGNEVMEKVAKAQGRVMTSSTWKKEL